MIGVICAGATLVHTHLTRTPADYICQWGSSGTPSLSRWTQTGTLSATVVIASLRLMILNAQSVSRNRKYRPVMAMSNSLSIVSANIDAMNNARGHRFARSRQVENAIMRADRPLASRLFRWRPWVGGYDDAPESDRRR